MWGILWGLICTSFSFNIYGSSWLPCHITENGYSIHKELIMIYLSECVSLHDFTAKLCEELNLQSPSREALRCDFKCGFPSGKQCDKRAIRLDRFQFWDIPWVQVLDTWHNIWRFLQYHKMIAEDCTETHCNLTIMCILKHRSELFLEYFELRFQKNSWYSTVLLEACKTVVSLGSVIMMLAIPALA